MGAISPFFILYWILINKEKDTKESESREKGRGRGRDGGERALVLFVGSFWAVIFSKLKQRERTIEIVRNS
jgi:hypothetical protein